MSDFEAQAIARRVRRETSRECAARAERETTAAAMLAALVVTIIYCFLG